ncbi:MAG TPA: hypothetical protein VFW11_15545, partial [Cyclobacteriaceae bacterium]|nr:hypothetical protein [Cyclobacteriaceae bacterium]
LAFVGVLHQQTGPTPAFVGVHRLTIQLSDHALSILSRPINIVLRELLQFHIQIAKKFPHAITANIAARKSCD